MIIDFDLLNTALTDAKARFTDSLQSLIVSGDAARVSDKMTGASLTEDSAWLGFFPSAQAWDGPKSIKSLRAYAQTVTSEPFEATVGLDKFRIMNAERNRGDRSLGNALGLNKIMERMGVSAAVKDDQLVFAKLAAGDTDACHDGVSFFNAAHPNGDQATFSNNDASADVDEYFILDTRFGMPIGINEFMPATPMVQSGPESDNYFINGEIRIGYEVHHVAFYGLPQLAFRSTKTINLANLRAHITTMKGYVNDQGQKLGVSPNLIVCGPSNEFAVRDVLQKPFDNNGATNMGTGLGLDLLVTPYLT